jgi:hypothetical protein
MRWLAKEICMALVVKEIWMAPVVEFLHRQA